jgi:hypothetical protein
VDYGERIRETWQDGTIIDMSEEMSCLSMTIVGKVLFDVDVFTEAGELGAALTTSFDYINSALSALYPLPLSWPLPRHLRTQRCDRRLTMCPKVAPPPMLIFCTCDLQHEGRKRHCVLDALPVFLMLHKSQQGRGDHTLKSDDPRPVSST